MANCRFHPQKEAKAYCPRCNFFFCQSCGKPHQECSLCHKAKLIVPERAPIQVKKVRQCTAHPMVTEGLKACQDCGKLFCQECIRFGGICARCSRKATADLAAVPKPKRLEHAPVDVQKKFRKGRKRAIIRWGIAGVIVSAIGALLYHDYGMLKQFAAKVPNKQLAAMMSGVKGGKPPESFEDMMSRLERGEITAQEYDETEALMAKIAEGKEVGQEQRELANRLQQLQAKGLDSDVARGMLGGKSGVDLQKPQSEQSRKMWALLSDWSNQGEGSGKALRRADRPASKVSAPRFTAAPATPAPQPGAVGVRIGGLASRQQVHGMVTVNTQLQGIEQLDHVELLVNGQWQGLSNQPPYKFEWDTSGNPNGPCTVQLVAYDAEGNKYASMKVPIKIAN